jgi:hypothetical protein
VDSELKLRSKNETAEACGEDSESGRGRKDRTERSRNMTTKIDESTKQAIAAYSAPVT